jgi:hypothetical protein
METLEKTPTGARRTWRTGFFTVMSAVVLLLVVIGFVPTFYLRPIFDVPPIPAYLYLHGLIMTIWFVWFVGQSFLVSAGLVTRHRQFGRLGAIFGVVVVVGSLMASLGFASRVASRGLGFDADASVLGVGVTGLTVAAFISYVVWGNIASLLSFATFLLAAVVLRRRPQAHKRLMLLASISIIGPALARILRWPVFSGIQGPAIQLVMWSSLVLALAVHDLISRRRLHPATVFGALLLVLTNYVGVVVGGSAVGQTLIRELR